MYSSEKNIEQLLDQYMGELHSDRGLVVYLNPDGSLFVIAQFLQYCSDKVDVGICLQVSSIRAVTEVLGISCMNEFKSSSVDNLMSLYKNGWAEMYCSVRDHGDFPLRFQKTAIGVLVLDDNDEVIEEIVSEGNPVQMVMYTYNYFCSITMPSTKKLHFEF